jgi:integration host factor subunit beta
MIKNDVALAIEKKSEFNRAKSLLIVEAVLGALKDALANKEKVEIRGFGSFKVVAKKTGFGRDIRRRKQIRIEKGHRIKFRPGQELKTLLSDKKPDRGPSS